jgi:DNA processing protein
MTNIYLAALYSFEGFGTARVKLLIDYFGGAKEAWNSDADALIDVGINKELVGKFISYRNAFDFDFFLSILKKEKINLVSINDPDYPENLKGLDDAPLVLYYKGKLSKNDINSVAIVGSRRMTSYGRDVTQKIASELASFGIAIVSGLAFGVDMTAHESALDAGGKCIAVLASGVNVVTPYSNRWLGSKIIEAGGVIISEYPPNTKAKKHYFPYRNRIISGLSKAVIVVEGRIKSGTIHTANHAASQGRSVFAVPGQILSVMSEAPHYLIKNGAKLFTSVSDVLDELNLQLRVDRDKISEFAPADDLERLISDILDCPKHVDEIRRRTGLKISEISAKLTVMEIKGIVKNLGGGIYRRN